MGHPYRAIPVSVVSVIRRSFVNNADAALCKESVLYICNYATPLLSVGYACNIWVNTVKSAIKISAVLVFQKFLGITVIIVKKVGEISRLLIPGMLLYSRGILLDRKIVIGVRISLVSGTVS